MTITYPRLFFVLIHNHISLASLCTFILQAILSHHHLYFISIRILWTSNVPILYMSTYLLHLPAHPIPPSRRPVMFTFPTTHYHRTRLHPTSAYSSSLLTTLLRQGLPPSPSPLLSQPLPHTFQPSCSLAQGCPRPCSAKPLRPSHRVSISCTTLLRPANPYRSSQVYRLAALLRARALSSMPWPGVQRHKKDENP
ncbi:uncharacterized protein BDZ99DRAFT_214013 [Mytilinidion resinicola]|uniref:Uncharacterized protein n=1 Tax=Mytilinidion resinicola TaxID=574789 RepID=A0A6A6Y1E8_9PEZI|nr:uncharacterized protein BDZ99DRAFT_214013 [Mytilinidion resinicola]KAF2801834.1 hypothetical protein BDZ99DRAFT_214013 [Mytilinidion resinicola]